jgi:5-methylcytosine-specific restriction endonuclease McrA
MPTKPKTFRPAGVVSYEKSRGSSSQRGYSGTRWGKTRQRIALRDGMRCAECRKFVGMRPGDFHCDHIVERPVGAPVNVGTYDADANLQILCVSCHNRKTGRYSRKQ